MAWFDGLLRPEIAALRAYHPARSNADAIRLDANESPFALSDHARKVIAHAIANIDLHRYPDVRATRLSEQIAEREGAHPDQIILGCGSDEIIALIIHALGLPRPGAAKPVVLFPEPTFVMFRLSALGSGAEPVGVPLDHNWDLDVDAMLAAIERHQPHAVFLPSPNNPTSNTFSSDRIHAVLHATREKSLVLLDEAYARFAGVSFRAERERFPHVGQLQTLSKVGLAAARVGWAILPIELAREIDKVRQPYNLNTLSQRVAELAFGELSAEFAQSVETIVSERSRLLDAVRAIDGFAVTEPAANFLWVNTGRNAESVYEALMARGVIVRSFHNVDGRVGNHLRITVGTPAENDRLVEALRAVCP